MLTLILPLIRKVLALLLLVTPLQLRAMPFLEWWEGQATPTVTAEWSEKLGLEESALIGRPDFVCFAQKNYLHKHLHLHELALYEQEEWLYLPVEGNHRPWSDWLSEIEVDEEGSLISHLFTHKGYVAGQPDSGLHVHRQRLPTGHPYLEIVSADITLLGRHTWVRLINGEGEEISAGYWPRQTIKSVWRAVRSLIPVDGELRSPDLHEVVHDPATALATPLPLTQEEYDLLHDYLEQLQAEAPWYELLGYFGYNCGTLVEEVLNLLGYNLSFTSYCGVIACDTREIYRWQLEQKRGES